MVNAADVPTTGKELLHKTDSIDSRKIARSLRAKELKSIYIPSMSTLENRDLLRVKNTVVNDLRRLKQRVKMLLYFHGVHIPAYFTNDTIFSKRFIRWLREEASGKEGVNREAFLFLMDELEAKKRSLKIITQVVSLLGKKNITSRIWN